MLLEGGGTFKRSLGACPSQGLGTQEENFLSLSGFWLPQDKTLPLPCIPAMLGCLIAGPQELGGSLLTDTSGSESQGKPFLLLN